MKTIQFMVLKEFCQVSSLGVVAIRRPGDVLYSEDPRVYLLVKRGLIVIDMREDEKLP